MKVIFLITFFVLTREVKAQTIKTAIESACLLLRVDDIVSGISKKKESAPAQAAPAPENAEEMAA